MTPVAADEIALLLSLDSTAAFAAEVERRLREAAARPDARFIRHAVRTVLRHLGWQRRRFRPPIDYRGRTGDALEASGRAGGRPFIVDVPLDRLRVFLNFRVARGVGNPFVTFCSDVLAGAPAIYSGSALERFYERWQPKNLGQRHGLAEPMSKVLRVAPAWVPFFPWLRGAPMTVAAAFAAGARSEHRLHGHDAPITEGHLLCGPWSPRKGEIEAHRFAAIARSLATHGYRPDAAGGGRLLVSGNEWAVAVTHGQHRASAAAAVGLPTIPVNVGGTPLRREDIPHWPLVAAGVYSAAEAATIFDALLAGRPPALD